MSKSKKNQNLESKQEKQEKRGEGAKKREKNKPSFQDKKKEKREKQKENRSPISKETHKISSKPEEIKIEKKQMIEPKEEKKELPLDFWQKKQYKPHTPTFHRNVPKKNNKGVKIGLALLLVLGLLGGVTAFFIKYFGNWNEIKTTITTTVVETVSAQVGTEMKKDEYGNVNVLLLGYGGDNHDGGYLTDSIIIASRNPKEGPVSLFSIPRDLRVKYPYRGTGKINGAFYQVLVNNERDLAKAGSGILKYFEEITAMKIPYYAMIDFKSFQGIVDAIGGIDIEVPETIHDISYPGPNRSYVTFHIDAGFQHLDGATALKYARSRHSTSDFSRSLRQQKILFGIKDKIINSGLNVDTLQSLYEQYKTYVTTNVDLQEMLRSLAYLKNIKGINSYGFTTNCGYANHERMTAACFLYTPLRENFGGASVMLPEGATENNIANYKHMQNFVTFLISNPLFLKEKAKVGIQNGVDKNVLVKNRLGNAKIAGNLAVKMKRYGFTIGTVENASETGNVSYIKINKPGDYLGTVREIQKMIPIKLIYPYNPFASENITSENGENLSGTMQENFGEDVQEEKDDITIVLGADYIVGNEAFSGLAQKKFSYEI